MLLFFDTCSSTQEELKKIENFEDEVLGLYTFHQTHGVGQQGTKWISRPNSNLTISFRIDENKFPSPQFFNVWFTLFVFEFILNLLDSTIFIKWPNDIFIGNQKVAGILIEKIGKFFFAGVGVNVFERNVENATFLARFNEKLAKLQNADERKNALRSLHEKMYHDLKEKLQSTKQHPSFSELKILFEKALYRRDMISVFEISNHRFNGIIRGISDDGELLVETDEGIKSFKNKEVRLLN